MSIIHVHPLPTQVFAHSNQNPPNRSIVVLSIEPGHTPGVIAVCTVRCGGIVFHQVTVANRGRGWYVNFPARRISDHWVDLVEIISPALRAHVVAVVLGAVREWMATR